jgi:hypothetical protein
MGSLVAWGIMLQAGRSRVRFPTRSLDFLIDLSFQPHYDPGIDSASNINEYPESSWGLRAAGRRGKADNFTAMCQPTAKKSGSLDVSHPYGPPQSATAIYFYQTNADFSKGYDG